MAMVRHRYKVGQLMVCLVLGVLGGAALADGAEAQDAWARAQAACAAEADTPAAQGRYRDLELFVLAEAREARGTDSVPAQVRAYLKTYFPASKLLKHLPPVPADTPVLESWEPDPEWLRLVREGVRLAQTGAEPVLWRDWFDLAKIWAQTPQSSVETGELREFLGARPEAPLAGWAEYQLLWEQRVLFPGPGSAEGLREFWAQHPEHPLATEASEALDVPWFSPEHLAHLSAVLPGWGEEVLEPGLHAASQALLSETVYLLGAAAFWSAAQTQTRSGNLTGALIFLNLLLLNHHGSAETAYTTAVRRNAAERRKFINAHLDRELAGAGHFSAPAPLAATDEHLAQDWVLGAGYRFGGAAQAWRGQGLVRDEQLENLSLTLDWVQTFWDTPPAVWRAGAGWMPHAQVFSTRAQGLAEAPFVSEVNVFEAGAALEAVGLLRWDLGGSWLQLRLGAGPGYRRRTASGSGFAVEDAGRAWFANAVVTLGGESGVYWQAGFQAEDSFEYTRVQLPDRVLTLPSRGEEVQFSLGVRF